MFKTILVALDLSDTFDALFDKALALAQTTGANLTLLSVLTLEGDGSIPSPFGLSGYPLGINEVALREYQKYYQEYEAREQAKLRSFAERAKSAGTQAEYSIVSGSPGRAICDRAKACNADLVMVGSHQRSGIQELLIGSVSNYVMHRAPCSVMIVHNQATTPTVATPSKLAATR